jgi:nucleotide-binding universal stress UspA family protein
MYKRILVPLDGSELAECVLPHVESIIKGCQVPDVIFIRVVEPVHIPTSATDMSMVFSEKDAERARKRAEEMGKADAENYLSGITARAAYDNARSQSVILSGKAAETIAEYAEENGIDLIVIATHGRSGISRWVWGGTADKILRSAGVPVFMIRAPGCVPGF